MKEENLFRIGFGVGFGASVFATAFAVGFTFRYLERRFAAKVGPGPRNL